MRSTRFGACAGAVIFGMSLASLAQPPDGKGKPMDAGRPAHLSFPVPQHSVGVLHAASLIQSQRPAPPPPAMTAPGPATGGIGHAFGRSGGTGTGAGLGIGQADKVSAKVAGVAPMEKASLDKPNADDGRRYSLQAVLPVAPGGFPAIQQEVPIPECFAR
jgi:hypothetical protein